MYAVNLGTRGPEQARDIVEYANHIRHLQHVFVLRSIADLGHKELNAADVRADPPHCVFPVLI